MKGSFCIPLFWEVGISYSSGQTIFALALKWWPKGANFLIEIKYHLLRSRVFGACFVVRTRSPEIVCLSCECCSGPSSPRAKNTLKHQPCLIGLMADQKTETFRIWPLAEMSSQMNMSVESSRLVVHHSHNDGDALIGHPRRAYK